MFLIFIESPFFISIFLQRGQNILEFVKEISPNSPILKELEDLFRVKGKNNYSFTKTYFFICFK